LQLGHSIETLHGEARLEAATAKPKSQATNFRLDTYDRSQSDGTIIERIGKADTRSTSICGCWRWSRPDRLGLEIIRPTVRSHCRGLGHLTACVVRSIGQRKGVTMSRMSISHIAMLLAIGAIVPMQSLAPRPGLAETLGNGNADGFAAIGISDSDAGSARATAIGGIAIGPESFALTKDATHPCAGGSDATDCGHGNIAIGISSQATNDFAVAVGFVSRAGGLSSSAYGPNSARLLAPMQMLLETAASPPAAVRPPTDSSRSQLDSARPPLTQRLPSAVRRTRGPTIRLPWDKAARRPARVRLRPVHRRTPRETSP
jgi:hypothetical protein